MADGGARERAPRTACVREHDWGFGLRLRLGVSRAAPCSNEDVAWQYQYLPELLPCDDRRYRVVTPRVMDIQASQTDSGAELAFLFRGALVEGRGLGPCLRCDLSALVLVPIDRCGL